MAENHGESAVTQAPERVTLYRWIGEFGSWSTWPDQATAERPAVTYVRADKLDEAVKLLRKLATVGFSSNPADWEKVHNEAAAYLEKAKAK